MVRPKLPLPASDQHRAGTTGRFGHLCIQALYSGEADE